MGTTTGSSLARGAIGLREVLFQSVTSMAPAGAVAPTSPAAPAWPASGTAWRRSAAGSFSTARAGREPPCAQNSRSP